ncbi:hypothetical protein [Streptomyces griseoluteus]|uniref:hypothetical protein n=1 Tax=Streptomyces griseoluteus TaxID=29306 RepID=UPI003696C987
MRCGTPTRHPISGHAERAQWIAEDRARVAALRATPGNDVPWQAMTDPAHPASTAEQAAETP